MQQPFPRSALLLTTNIPTAIPSSLSTPHRRPLIIVTISYPTSLFSSPPTIDPPPQSLALPSQPTTTTTGIPSGPTNTNAKTPNVTFFLPTSSSHTPATKIVPGDQETLFDNPTFQLQDLR
ncbi:hypothetical protein L1887_10148 [Cichorium endivia]|nr:hypothetical protein L1887_10148 [Cichorium endivia]